MSPKITADGSIYHCNAIRVRVTGSCSLRPKLLSLPDDVGVQVEKELVPLDITTSTFKILERRTNFKQQRMQLELKTTEINEYFRISTTSIFIKYSSAGYPGTR